jgi:hypothetical protein
MEVWNVPDSFYTHRNITELLLANLELCFVILGEGTKEGKGC